MNKKLPKVHWPTKALSNKNYILEVSIDGKKTSLFHFHLGYFDLYIQQVMRAGNCLTLLSSPPVFSLECFKNANLFEDAVKYVFWTFHKAFLLRLKDFLTGLPPSELQNCYDLLKTHPGPYPEITEQEADEELLWCNVKNNRLKSDPKFGPMYERDKNNRAAVLDFLRLLLDKAAGEKKETVAEALPKQDKGLFGMLLPIYGTENNTLAIMEQTVIAAGFPHNPFHPVAKNKKGANQYGLNAEMAAILFFFQQQDYFKTEYTFKDIYKAFGKFTSNQSGKDYNLDHFREDYLFEKYLKLLEDTDNQAI